MSEIVSSTSPANFSIRGSLTLSAPNGGESWPIGSVQTITWTKTGKALRAVAQDREAALALGIEPDRLYAIAWGISAAAAGVAGSLVSSFMYVNPLVGDVFLLPGFAAVALGGFGNVYGAFAGGLVIGVVNVTGGTLTMPKVKLALVYLVFLAVLFMRPRGLFGGRRQ